MGQPKEEALYAAMVLTILSSIGCLLLGLFFVLGFHANLLDYPNSPPDYMDLFVGVFGIISFVFGLLGTVATIDRRRFPLAIVGPSLMTIESLIVTLYISAQGVVGFYTVLLLVLAFLATVYVAIAKQVFR